MLKETNSATRITLGLFFFLLIELDRCSITIPAYFLFCSYNYNNEIWLLQKHTRLYEYRTCNLTYRHTRKK